MSMTVSLRKEDRSYTYSLIGGGISHLHIGIRSLPVLTSRHENRPSLTPPDLPLFRFIIILGLLYTRSQG